MKITDWISEEECEGKEESCGSMGGWFNSGYVFETDSLDKNYNPEDKKGMRWQDYLDHMPKNEHPYLEAIRSEVLMDNLRITGSMHQDDYIPLFSDGTIGIFSFRGWGDLMAAIFSEKENTDYTYMDFYFIYWKGLTLNELEEKGK